MPQANRQHPPYLRLPALVALVILVTPLLSRGVRAAQPSGNIDDYFAFAFRRMLLKDFHLEAPGCNLGVNCEETGRTCGNLSMSEAVVPAPGLLAGDNVCGTGSFYQVFRNNTGASCSPDCNMISAPGPGPNCENTFTTPILGDLDGDGQPSCDGRCVVDIGDVAAACGVSYPFPPCNSSRAVIVYEDNDCFPASLDTVPGNHQCDLAAGTYGMIRVRNKGRINFGAGTTVACTLAVAKAARVTSTGPAQILIPGYGWASFGNLSDVGGACRSFKVVTEYGPLRFAKHGEFHLDACSLGGTLRLGHDNNLRGRFVSGAFIASNYNNTGGCCEGPTTTISTTTSTTSTTSTTLPPGSICCQDITQEPPACGSAPSAAACLESGGIPGPVGSVCEADPTGGGRCTDAPPNPGGCCQFDNGCAIGGALNELICSSLGGAFVADAVCDPGGNCIPITSTTTSTTLMTVTTVTTITSTTSTTNTTNPPGSVCCEDLGVQPPVCGSAESAGACLAAGGTPGPSESTCQADPGGGGRCKTGPPSPGGCCQFEGSCALGDGLDAVACSSLGGAFVTDAVCTPDGNCVPVTATTTSTTVTTASTSSSSSTSTSTLTTSTTSTTTPQGPVCCDDASAEPPICGSAESAAACLAAGGSPGPAESTCQANAEGGGRCKTGPPSPGSCCQFDGSCALGDGLDAVTCGSLGGAFVADAICTPDGNCVPVTATTTSTTVTTASTSSSSSTSTSTLTTSTTSTTTPQGPVCCDNVSAEPPACGSAESAAACVAAGGSPGPNGSVCQTDPRGGGRCKNGPPNPGGCCQFDGSCALGGEIDEGSCGDLGGTFVNHAICTPSGQCESGATTTSTTATTVTTVSTSSTSSSTSTSTSNSTSSTNSSTTVKTTSTTNTTNTTLPGSGFTRTLGFYKTHPGVTQWILDSADGVTVCGVEITNTDYDDAHSALEALCISPQGDQRLQLVRQLTAAALTMAAGGATYTNFTACDALCANGGGSIFELGDCINSADNFNNSGDSLPAPFDGFESGSPDYCRIAHMSSCTVLDPDSCNR